MKLLLLSLIFLVAPSSSLENASSLTTKTLKQCPPYPTPSATTYVPAAPTCTSVISSGIKYKLYGKKCYYQVDFNKDDTGNFFHNSRDDVCGAAKACAKQAVEGNGYQGPGSDYAFAIYWYAVEDPGWACYAFNKKPGPGPPLDQYDGDSAREVFAWAASSA